VSTEAVVVVGASSDIGLALIGRIAASIPNRPIIAHCNSSKDRLEKLARTWPNATIVPVVADLSDSLQAQRLASHIQDKFGTPFAVAYLPGLPLRYERLTKFDMTHFERDLAIQVTSAIHLFSAWAPRMAKLEGAKIAFLLSSVTRGMPPRYLSMYTIVKQAQLGLMRAIASEYSASSLSVNAVSPGMVDTRFLDNVPDLAKQAAAVASPRGRRATAAEVAGVLAFLMSRDSDYMTGIEIPVAGGALA
jgi:3-oxoacyl-[acyl-carrier protein] reductase